jgi:hypothetical protein
VLPVASALQASVTKEHARKLTISLISRGEGEENKPKAEEHGLSKATLANPYRAEMRGQAKKRRPSSKKGPPP